VLGRRELQSSLLGGRPPHGRLRRHEVPVLERSTRPTEGAHEAPSFFALTESRKRRSSRVARFRHNRGAPSASGKPMTAGFVRHPSIRGLLLGAGLALALIGAALAASTVDLPASGGGKERVLYMAPANPV